MPAINKPFARMGEEIKLPKSWT